MRSVYDEVKSVVSLVPAVRTSSANGTGISVLPYNSAKLVVQAGATDFTSTDETYDIKVQESSDNSTFTDVSGATGAITAANQTVQIRLDGLNRGSAKQYLRAVITIGGTSPSCACSAVFELGRAISNPVN
jgi:hypothetical protein